MNRFDWHITTVTPFVCALLGGMREMAETLRVDTRHRS